MWQKFKEQIPAVLLTALLVIGGAFWLHQQTVNQMAAKQQVELAPLRDANDALKVASEENRKQIESTNKLLRDAISKREADMFRSDEEVQKLKPSGWTPWPMRSPKRFSLITRCRNRRKRLSGCRPNRSIRFDPHGGTDSADPGRNVEGPEPDPRLDRAVQPADFGSGRDGSHRRAREESAAQQQPEDTQAAAQDALKLSHEITALYLSSFKDQGLITRFLSLPANVVRDAASLSIVTNSDRKKVEEQLVNKMAEIEKRLTELHTQAPNAAVKVTQSTPTRPQTDTLPESPQK